MFIIEFHIDSHQIEDEVTNVGDNVNVISHNQAVMANPFVLGTWSLAYPTALYFHYLSIKTPHLHSKTDAIVMTKISLRRTKLIRAIGLPTAVIYQHSTQFLVCTYYHSTKVQ